MNRLCWPLLLLALGHVLPAGSSSAAQEVQLPVLDTEADRVRALRHTEAWLTELIAEVRSGRGNRVIVEAEDRFGGIEVVDREALGDLLAAQVILGEMSPAQQRRQLRAYSSTSPAALARAEEALADVRRRLGISGYEPDPYDPPDVYDPPDPYDPRGEYDPPTGSLLDAFDRDALSTELHTSIGQVGHWATFIIDSFIDLDRGRCSRSDLLVAVGPQLTEAFVPLQRFSEQLYLAPPQRQERAIELAVVLIRRTTGVTRAIVTLEGACLRVSQEPGRPSGRLVDAVGGLRAARIELQAFDTVAAIEALLGPPERREPRQ